MKKTIAILLVLVIGMAGVFAAAITGTSDLVLQTTVAPINQMAVTSTDTEYSWSKTTLNGEFTSAFPTETAYTGLTDALNYDKDGTVAYLQARSNNRNGFSIAMTAEALKSDIGTTEVPNIQYIDYVAKCGDAEVSTVGGVTTVTAGTVATIAYADEVAYLDITPITVNLTESLEDAADGTYEGTITFSYTAV